jgi:hypothetical protein
MSAKGRMQTWSIWAESGHSLQVRTSRAKTLEADIETTTAIPV